MTLSDLVEYCRAEALAGKFYPSDESTWRWFCRQYSKTFFTPLHQVFELNPELVITAVFEDGMDSYSLRKDEDVDKLIEELRRAEDPNYDETKKEEMDTFQTLIEAWEDDRVAAGGARPKKGVQPELEIPKKKELPTSGGINLAYLAKEEESDPDSGFEDEES